MNEITQILCAIERGEQLAAHQLLPLVYDELRKLALAKLQQERPGQTLQATALVHDAYLRLVGADNPQRWDSRGHFFAAAAEAMRRILVEAARRKARLKHGGGRQRDHIDRHEIALAVPSDQLLAIHEALERLEGENPQAALLVKLRYFVGLTIPETAAQMAISPRKADQVWAYAKAWLATEIADDTVQ